MSETLKQNVSSNNTDANLPIPMDTPNGNISSTDTDADLLILMDTSNDGPLNGSESGLPMKSSLNENVDPMDKPQGPSISDTDIPQQCGSSSSDNGTKPGFPMNSSLIENTNPIYKPQVLPSTDTGTRECVPVNVLLTESGHDLPMNENTNGENVGVQEASTTETDNLTSDVLLSPKPSKVLADQFKEFILHVLYEDFCKPYSKLKVFCIPNCTSEDLCKKFHEEFPNVSELKRFDRPTIFTELDAPFHNWELDICIMINNLITSYQYLRGDMIRVLFDYILNGPSEHLMMEIKSTIRFHFLKQPPCLEEIRTYYLTLLNLSCQEECYFRTCLEHIGIFHHLMREIERFYKEKISGHQKDKKLSRHCTGDEGQDDSASDHGERPTKCAKVEEVPFDLLLDRHNKFKDLYDPEIKQTIDTIDAIGTMKAYDLPVDKMKNSQILPRLVEALDLVNDLLEADFLICVSKLKRFIKGESDQISTPLISRFIKNDNLVNRVISLYSLGITDGLRYQLIRLIGMMAEECHLFNEVTYWDYLTLNQDCINLSDNLFIAIRTCHLEQKWRTDDLYMQLVDIRPTWLRQRVTMKCVNELLNVNMGTDLSTIVEMIHMHVKHPLSADTDTTQGTQNNTPKVVPEDGYSPDTNSPESLRRKAEKRNCYGETLLHRVCRKKDEQSDRELEQLLALRPPLNVNKCDNHGWAPLHEAVYHGATAKVLMLLQHKPSKASRCVEVGIQNREGTTPLHEAVNTKNLEICKMLIKYGGTQLLRKIDKDGITPVDLADDKPEINQYFSEILTVQENLNLNPNSSITLSKNILKMLVMSAEDLMSEGHTLDMYLWIKMSGIIEPKQTSENPGSKVVIVHKNTLLVLKKNQEQIRRLVKILGCLAKNDDNSIRYSLWYMKYKALKKKVGDN